MVLYDRPRTSHSGRPPHHLPAARGTARHGVGSQAEPVTIERARRANADTVGAAGWIERLSPGSRELHLSGLIRGIHLRVPGWADAVDLEDRFLHKPAVMMHSRRHPEEVPSDITLALAPVDAVTVPEINTA